MRSLTGQAILGGMSFLAMWTALTLLLSDATLYQLLLGAITAIVFGAGWYWWGNRLQQQSDE